MSGDMRLVIVQGLQAQNEALRERLAECEELLATYGTDVNGDFATDVERYFDRYGSTNKNWSHVRSGERFANAGDEVW